MPQPAFPPSSVPEIAALHPEAALCALLFQHLLFCALQTASGTLNPHLAGRATWPSLLGVNNVPAFLVKFWACLADVAFIVPP